MFSNSDQLPAAWAREVISRGERMVPALSHVILTECNWHRSDAGWCCVVHATFLLGAIGGDMAIVPLVHALRQAECWDNDWIGEEIASIFGNLGPRALAHLREMARDRQTDWYVRDKAMEGMAAVALRSPECEQEVFSFLAGVAADLQEDRDVRVGAGHILLDFGKREHEPLLTKLLESGVAKGEFDQDDIRRCLKEKDLCWYERDWLDFYDPKNIAERRERWEKGRLPESAALEQASSTEWGSEPEWDDEEDGLDLEAGDNSGQRPRLPRNMRLVTEKALFQTSRAIKDKDFKSVEEINRYLGGLGGQPPGPAAPQGAWDVAQNLMYEAWEEEDPEKRVDLARKALKICPDCCDAYSLLAEETAETLDQSRELYAKAVKAGERQLGPEFFKEHEGHFWGMIETRPYMRARAALADDLWNLGDFEAALGHWYEMLRLNPNDNQGMRYILAATLGRLGRHEELEKLLGREEYKDDVGLEWLVMKALAAFAREGPSAEANHALQEALGRNRHLPDYLLGTKTIPRKLPGHVALGSEDEAIACAANVLPAWRRAAEASEWLEQAMGRTRLPSAGRNDPCPCGSGKKFKKCCLGKDAGWLH
ncbi:MAG: SEC-C domain-containing protein [Elusimicrobia bacterium]|nr:SEC-C domain-containing protein [Elusimicrobiota bacterium]